MNIETEIAHVLSPLGSGVRLLTAVSGGADSVALLVSLRRIGMDVVAAHCNFHLRGEESDRDQLFVEKLCERLGVRLELIHFDVDEHRRAHGGSMEMACRELRYRWFYGLRTALGCTRILTAHHADDNVETMLLNMLRGCGLEGAKGMVADTGVVMRPLLRVHRADIEAYLKSLGQEWIVDSTNLESEPDRNFIRLEVLPLLERRFPGASGRLARTQGYLGEAYKVYSDWRSGIDETHLPLDMLKASPVPATLLHEWLRPHGFTASQEQEIISAAATPSVRTRMWTPPPADCVVLMDAHMLRLVGADPPQMSIEEREIRLTPEIVASVRANSDRNVAYMPSPLRDYELRTIHPGDRMVIGARKTKKVSDVMKEGGIPRPWRGAWPVLADKVTGEIVWIPGVRRSARQQVKIADGTLCYKLTARRK